MIIEEMMSEILVKHYSSDGKHIKQIETGEIIEESAIDAFPCPYTYEEYDGEMPKEQIDDTEALEIILGDTE